MKKTIFTFLITSLLLVGGKTYSQLQPPILLYPPNGATNITTTPLMDWTDVTGATSYNLQIYDSTLNLVVNQTGLLQSQYQVPPNILNPNTQYNWRAAAVNSSQTSWSGFWGFRTSVLPPQAPTLLAPPNGATNVTTTPTFDWNDVPNASYYRIQVSTDSNFTATTIDVNGLTSSQYVVNPGNPLANGTRFYWRVNATNIGGTSPWSAVWNLSTVPSPPPPPNLIFPSNGATGISLTPTLDWSDVIGATGYKLNVSTDSLFINLIIDVSNLTASEYTVPAGAFSGSTRYYWRVSSVNLGGQGLWSPYRFFTTVLGPPAAPVLLAPPNGQLNVTRFPLFDWNDVPTSLNYILNVALDSNFTSIILTQTVTVSQYQVLSALNYNTTYYWRVRAVNVSGPGNWSSVWWFRTQPVLPSPPTLIAPPNGATNVTLTPTMDWTDVPEATSYRLQISTNSIFSSIVLNEVVTTSSYNVSSGILIGGQTYYWRVYSINATGQGAASTVWSFLTRQAQTSNLKIFLEGFYSPSTQLQVLDTVKVYLANTSPPYNFIDSTRALLNNIGTGTASFELAPNNNYYIVIRHRNHLETWSSLPQQFVIGNPVNYDFTTASSKAYGNNMKLVGAVWVFWGGDADQDGTVLPSDYDVFKLGFGKNGYLSPDFNGDNFVDGYDLFILYNNFFKSKSRP